MSLQSNVMLELAAQAFLAGNFELAADIYECQLRDFGEPATQRELLLRRADALAFGGKLSEAFEIYRRASKLERLRPEQLERLTECLSHSIRSRGVIDSTRSHQGGTCYEEFACRICQGFLYEPVTLPCGHTYCKKCLDRDQGRGRAASCKECKDTSKAAEVTTHRVNVLLGSLLAKWFPAQVLAVQLRHQGNVLYAEKRIDAALEKYNEAIRLASRDHVLFSNRSQINCNLKKYENALNDAEIACFLQPLSLKGHLRRAQALTFLRKSEEALTEYLFCIALDPENKIAKLEAQKLLSGLFAPVPEDVQERIPDCVRLLSPRARLKEGTQHTLTWESSTPSGLHNEHFKKRCLLSSQGKLLSVSLKKAFEVTSTISSEDRSQAVGIEEDHHPCEFSRKRKHNVEDEETAYGLGVLSKHAKLESALNEVPSRCSPVIDASDLECPLCMRLFYEPVTTPCGHTFCLKCLERCLDHNPQCPLCKEGFSEYLAQRKYSKTILMEDLIAKYLPEELVERRKVYEEEIAELSNLNKNVPIFVCTMAFPTVPCPLHIFEPCYRLMIRRCMETGTKQFGMCLSDPVKGFADYGCILEIRNVEFFADGRSVVDTIGKRRFKVIEHSQRDGYNTADIEYLEDRKVEGQELAELLTLHDTVYDQAIMWINSLKSEQKERIVSHFGPMPEKEPEPQMSPNGPSWCWWLLAVLPLEGRAQLPFLALTALKDRLLGIRRVLMFMSRNRPR
ncbi:LON peptidase N-terminal domain and RING finger protein 3-like isoform X1 [Polypterus senegalus]|uniref:LON peptidase N-terminal domain and RING finger protein 3-like isoform X1 n=1 Tax=Polypterus senegalus TaxID=55291 RepID=UPI001963ED94|nr:LON peptidase N-terminal domain and RING finger protein 3-like isoform X1 [Polypterus senegalus]